MKTLLLMVIICGAILTNAQNSSGVGYEQIVGILESMQNDIKAIRTKVDELKADHDKLNEKFNDNEKAMNLTMDLLMQGNIEATRTKVDKPKSIRDKLNEEFTDHKRAFNSTIDLLSNATESSCPTRGSNGVYTLEPFDNQPLSVYCEDGWIVIQRHTVGSSGFNKNWNEYRNGFGDLEGEYWMGLERIYQITHVGSFELLVVLDFLQGQKRATYEGFKIAGEMDQYRLDVNSFVEGDAGDIFRSNRGAKFSTPDRDNGGGDENCSSFQKSGWWFADVCFILNLNAINRFIEIDSRITAESDMTKSRMMIRAVK